MTFLYLDSSALVKRYVDEPHSEEVADLTDETLAVGTSAISRVEVGAALARAARGNRLDAEGGSPSPGAVRRRLAGFRQGTRYRQAPRSRRETRLEARAAGIRCRTARSRPRMRGHAHGTRRQRPVRMLRRRADSRSERRGARDLAGLTELPPRHERFRNAADQALERASPAAFAKAASSRWGPALTRSPAPPRAAPSGARPGSESFPPPDPRPSTTATAAPPPSTLRPGPTAAPAGARA